MKVSRPKSKGPARPAKRPAPRAEANASAKDSPYGLESLTGDNLIQRQEAPVEEDAPHDICEDLREAIAQDEATIHRIVPGSLEVNPNERADRKQMLEMCEAVADGDKKKIELTLEKALDLLPNMGNFMAPSGAGPLLNVRTAQKIFARLMELGLSDEAMTVYQKMDDLERDTFASRERKFWRKKAYFQAYFDLVLGKLAQGDSESALSDLALIRDALPRIAKGIEGMSWSSIYRSYMFDIRYGNFNTGSTRLHDYFNDIWDFLLQLTIALQTPFQRGIDKLILEMSGGVDEAPAELEEFGARLEEQLQQLRETLRTPAFARDEPSFGAELALYLVDDAFQPTPVVETMLSLCNDRQLTPELNRYNLEFNLTPVSAAGSPFTAMEVELREALDRVQAGGHHLSATLGKHTNDKMVSFYVRTPSGFDVEVGCGGIHVDEATWITSEITAPSFWGHRWDYGQGA